MTSGKLKVLVYYFTSLVAISSLKCMDYLILEPQPSATLHFLLKGGVSVAYNFARHVFCGLPSVE